MTTLFEKVVNQENISDTQSIEKHLFELLNTRQGSIVHEPDYGLPDLSSIYDGLPHSINYLIRCIESVIEKYEPRLKNAVVLADVVQDESCVLSLTIQGEIDQQPSFFLTKFGQSVEVSVSK